MATKPVNTDPVCVGAPSVAGARAFFKNLVEYFNQETDASLKTSAAYMSGYKNKLINGNFRINQRAATGTVTLAAGAYGHDRWKAGASGCTYTFATIENVTTLTISAGSLLQTIEGLNLFTGTHILSWQGTCQGRIGAGVYSVSGITGVVVGGTNLNIEFGTGTLKLVQFEQGGVVTPFESRRSVGQELVLCQRYYEITTVVNGIIYDPSYMGTNGACYSVEKMVSPSCGVSSPSYGGSYSGTPGTLFSVNSDTKYVYLIYNWTSGYVGHGIRVFVTIYANAEL